MTKARGAGRPRASLAKANRVEVMLNRRRLGSLAALKVGPRTARRYWASLRSLFEWIKGEKVALPEDEDEMDAVVVAWQEGEGRSFAADAVCGLQWYRSLLRRPAADRRSLDALQGGLSRGPNAVRRQPRFGLVWSGLVRFGLVWKPETRDRRPVPRDQWPETSDLAGSSSLEQEPVNAAAQVWSGLVWVGPVWSGLEVRDQGPETSAQRPVTRDQ